MFYEHIGLGSGEARKERKEAVGIPMTVGLFLIGLCFYLIFLTSVLFFFGIPISVFHLPLAVLFSAGTCFLLSNRSKKTTLIAVTIGLMVVFAAVFLNRNVADVSWDGNAYHKSMAAFLRYGWNPLRETYYEFADNNFPFFSPHQSVFLDAYPKGSEMIAACLYRIFGNLEASKVFNLLSLVGVMCICTTYLEKAMRLKAWQAWIGAAAFTVHPVSVAQVFSYLNDGFLWQMILLCTAACLYLLFFEDGIYKRLSLFFIFAAINIGFNIKFSGVIFFACLCAGIYVLWAVRLLWRQRTGQNVRKVLSGGIFYGITVFFGLAVPGSTSYVMNLIRHRNPLYSVFGDGAIDLIEPYVPTEYKNYSQFGRVWKALFSQYNDQYLCEGKVPFLFSSVSVSTQGGKIGGWGFLFCELLVLGLVILAVFLWKARKRNPLGCGVMGLLVFLDILMMAAVPGLWWPRYFVAPLFIPSFALVMLMRYSNEQRTGAIPVAAGFMACLCLINVSPSFSNNMRVYYSSQSAQKEWDRMRELSSMGTINITFDGLKSGYTFFDCYFDVVDNNIVNYTYVPQYEEGMHSVNKEGVSVYYSDPSGGIWATTDLVSFVNEAKKTENTALLISVKDEASTGLTEEMIQAMQGLGLKFDIKDQYRGSYLAVVDQGEVQYEESSMEQISYNGEIGENKISLTSAGFENGNTASVEINGEEYAVNTRGINMVLLDVETGVMLDSVAFDTFDSGACKRG